MAFALYRVTGASDITWLHQGEDGPEFAAVALTLGIAHPTGYPLYTLIGRLFTLVPGLSAGGALAIFSSLCAAVALALLFTVAREFAGAGDPGRPHDPACFALGPAVAIAALAISPTLWSQAMITEVYTLHLAFLALFFALALAAARTDDPRPLRLLAFVGGLAVAHHLAVIAIFPGLLALLLLERRAPRALLLALPFFVLGASVVAFLPIRGALHPRLQWGEHDTLEGLRWAMSGEQYHFRLKGFDVERFRGMLGAFVRRRVPNELGFAAYLLAPAGGLLLALNRPSFFLATFLPLVFGLGLTFAYEIPDPDAYYLPAYAIIAIWSAVALGAIATRARAWLDEAAKRRPSGAHLARAGAPVLAIALVAAALAPLPARARRLSTAHDHTARDYARDALAAMPPDALVLTQGDGRTFALWCAAAENGRDDAAVVYSALLCWPWYVEHVEETFPNIEVAGSSMKPDDMVDAFIAANLGRVPVLLSFTDARRANSYELIPRGPLFEVAGRRAEVPATPANVEQIAINITPYANADYHRDPFVPDPTNGENLFPHLSAGVIRGAGVEFLIFSDAAATGIPSVITTAFQEAARIEVPLHARASRAIALALDGGAAGNATIPLARLFIEYEDGVGAPDTLISNRDVWEYWEKNYSMTIPEDRLLWRAPNAPESHESLTLHFLACDSTRTPRALVIEGTGARGSDGAYAGVAVFAITQLFAAPAEDATASR
ncbi:MAG: protein O-mannosyl-transferase family [bacterium]